MAKTETESIERVWLTPNDAASYTQLHRITLWRARKQGSLRAGGAGRAVRFEKTELDRWMRSGGIDQT